MVSSGFGKSGAPDHVGDSMNACVRIGALELQDNDNYRLILSSMFTILN